MAINKEDLQVGKYFFLLMGDLTEVMNTHRPENVKIFAESLLVTNVRENEVAVLVQSQPFSFKRNHALEFFFYTKEDAEKQRERNERMRGRNIEKEAVDLLREVQLEMGMEDLSLFEKITNFLISIE